MIATRSARALLVAASFLAAAACNTDAWSQALRTRHIRLVVPFAAGGPTDLMGRALANALSVELGAAVVVENVAGAGGRIGLANVAKSEPDGYTLALAAGSQLAVAPALYGAKLSYDPAKMTPITLLAESPKALVVSAAVPADSFEGLIALAKAQPGALNYASLGVGSLAHLQAEQFKISAQVDIVPVAFTGSAPALLAMLRNEVQMMFDVVATTKSHVQAGSMKVLAVAWRRRLPEMPSVPTFAELGFPELGMTAWYGIVAPLNMPAELVPRINGAVRKVIASPEVRDALEKADFETVGSSPEQLTARIEHETAIWTDVIRASGIKID
jgi:tripartite-type tricarboxylate transporter receptor subunit TctC